MSLGDLINIIKDCDIYTAVKILIIALLFWLFNVYQRNANKSRDNTDVLLHSAITEYSEALKLLEDSTIDYTYYNKFRR